MNWLFMPVIAGSVAFAIKMVSGIGSGAVIVLIVVGALVWVAYRHRLRKDLPDHTVGDVKDRRHQEPPSDMQGGRTPPAARRIPIDRGMSTPGPVRTGASTNAGPVEPVTTTARHTVNTDKRAPNSVAELSSHAPCSVVQLAVDANQPSTRATGRQTEAANRAPHAAVALPPTRVIEFDRHCGVAGLLYAAHNEFHRTDLFKLGYTTLTVDERMASLNLEHESRSHVGFFRPVHSVPVTDTYGCEQLMFDVLNDFRVTAGREYFLLSQEAIDQVMDSISNGSRNIAALRRYLPVPSTDLKSIRRPVANAHLRPASGGSVYLLRNPCHREPLYRIGHTAGEPESQRNALNAAQRQHTSRVGFFNWAGWAATNQPRLTYELVLKETCRHRPATRSPYVSMAVDELTDLLAWAAKRTGRVEATAAAMNLDAKPLPRVEGERLTRMNFCPACCSPVSASAPLEHIGRLRCPSCQELWGFQILSERLEIWQD